MQKVVIFDAEANGDKFADYVEQELAIVDVIRVSASVPDDSRPKAAETLCAITEAALLPYIGHAEVIVLASYEVTLSALNYLHHKYPDQKMVGFWPELSHHLKKVPDDKRIMLLANDEVRHSSEYKEEKRRLERFEVVESDYGDWLKVMQDLVFRRDFIAAERQHTGKIDIVLLYGHRIDGLTDILERTYGWQIRVIDGYGEVFRETCTALGLRGKDGGRGRF